MATNLVDTQNKPKQITIVSPESNIIKNLTRLGNFPNSMKVVVRTSCINGAFPMPFFESWRVFLETSQSSLPTGKLVRRQNRCTCPIHTSHMNNIYYMSTCASISSVSSMFDIKIHDSFALTLTMVQLCPIHVFSPWRKPEEFHRQFQMRGSKHRDTVAWCSCRGAAHYLSIHLSRIV